MTKYITNQCEQLGFFRLLSKRKNPEMVQKYTDFDRGGLFRWTLSGLRQTISGDFFCARNRWNLLVAGLNPRRTKSAAEIGLICFAETGGLFDKSPMRTWIHLDLRRI